MTGLHRRGLLAVLALLGSAWLGMGTARADAVVPGQGAFERDRAAILAMVGNFRVTFDFTETVPFQEGYTLKEPKVTDATEIVRVIEDTGTTISLQHILLAGRNGEVVVKHWRQDWVYEPATIWDFTGFNAWVRKGISARDRAGAWAQLVYQVDDAPRYAAVGRWDHRGGISSWAGARSWRPLPRRDATTRDDYQVIEAVNRHVITPTGWVHEQDNTKLQVSEAGGVQALVREVGVNTYTRADDFDAGAAEAYWAATKGYWSGIREEWKRIAQTHAHFGLTIQGEPEELYGEILGFAEGLRSGDIPQDEAVTEAVSVIRAYLTDVPVDGRTMASP